MNDMNILALNYAIRLETLFSMGRDKNCGSSHDDFFRDPYNALEAGLGILNARGIIKSDEINEWMETVHFIEGENLSSYLSVSGHESLDEFIRCMKLLIKQSLED